MYLSAKTLIFSPQDVAKKRKENGFNKVSVIEQFSNTIKVFFPVEMNEVYIISQDHHINTESNKEYITLIFLSSVL